MAKKSFKDSARASVASAFMSAAQEDIQEGAQEVAQDVTHEVAQEATQKVAQVAARPSTDESHPAYIRTQGRKGKKKPRINMAFEPHLYEFIRAEAKRQDISLTQLVNEIIEIYRKSKKVK